MPRRNREPTREEPPNEGGSEHEVGEGSTQPNKRTRGATKMVNVWKQPQGQRILVEENDDHQPVGKHASSFASFIGVIARNSEYLPLTYDRWTNIPAATRARALELLKSKFDYPAVLDSDWVSKSMSKKWRDFKCELKASYYDEDRTMAANIRVVPKGVTKLDWEYLCHFWSSPEGKKMAERGRASRQVQDVLHTSGGTSFARRRAIMDAEHGGGDQYGDLDFFDATHINSQGVFASTEAASISSTARTRYAKLSSAAVANSATEFVNIVELQHQALVQEWGQECHGRVRGKGLGPTPSRSCDVLSTQPDPRDEKIRSLETQLSKLQEKVSHLFKETNVAEPDHIPRQQSDRVITGASQMNQMNEEGTGERDSIDDDSVRRSR